MKLIILVCWVSISALATTQNGACSVDSADKCGAPQTVLDWRTPDAKNLKTKKERTEKRFKPRKVQEIPTKGE